MKIIERRCKRVKMTIVRGREGTEMTIHINHEKIINYFTVDCFDNTVNYIIQRFKMVKYVYVHVIRKTKDDSFVNKRYE